MSDRPSQESTDRECYFSSALPSRRWFETVMIAVRRNSQLQCLELSRDRDMCPAWRLLAHLVCMDRV
jgi:hypothetical protein